jgi:glycerophosphoryl diester phosphodiesterase
MAIDNKVQSIELDVWLTKDKHLVVVHGGNNGEIHSNVD